MTPEKLQVLERASKRKGLGGHTGSYPSSPDGQCSRSPSHSTPGIGFDRRRFHSTSRPSSSSTKQRCWSAKRDYNGGGCYCPIGRDSCGGGCCATRGTPTEAIDPSKGMIGTISPLEEAVMKEMDKICPLEETSMETVTFSPPMPSSSGPP